MTTPKRQRSHSRGNSGTRKSDGSSGEPFTNRMITPRPGKQEEKLQNRMETPRYYKLRKHGESHRDSPKSEIYTKRSSHKDLL